jgi:uncharacterized membrane protein YedE/YeeE
MDMFAKIGLGLLCGIVLGFVLQRGRFCVVSAYRDVILVKDNRMFIAVLIAIAVQSIGVYALAGLGLIQLADVPFTWLGAIVGGFVFGWGIVLAGGCATGTWYRAGEGLLGSWIALFAYMLGTVATKSGVLKPAHDALTRHKGGDAFIYTTLGISPWVLILLFTALVSLIVWRHLRQPALVVPTLKPRKSGLAHLLFEKRWHPFVTALLVGIIAIAAWPMSEATGRMFGLGITTPSGNLLRYITTGDATYLDWAVFLVLGIALGSYIAAKGSGEFRWRLPDVKTIRHNFVGGLLMGFGASIAGGCTIGNGLVNTSLFTWQGWVATLFIIAGTWSATYVVIMRGRRKETAGAAPGQTAPLSM